MKLHEDQVKRFRTMMSDFARKHNMGFKFQRDEYNDPYIAELTFITDPSRMSGPKYEVNFAEAHSLTEAAAPIMADVMAKCNIDKAGCCVEIKNVIFNPPATIVYWADGTKTVVQTREGDKFDPEKGLAMAISKKALGNQGNYYNQFKKWTKKYEGPSVYLDGVNMTELVKKIRAAFGIKD